MVFYGWVAVLRLVLNMAESSCQTSLEHDVTRDMEDIECMIRSLLDIKVEWLKQLWWGITLWLYVHSSPPVF